MRAQANPNIQNDKGNTPLHEAAKVNNKDIVRLLLNCGANSAVTNKNGLTALQLAKDKKLARLITASMDQDPSESLDTLSKLRMPERGNVQASKSITKDADAVVSSKTKLLTKRESAVMRSDIFTALEDDDINKLRQLLLTSLNTFNKKSLRRTNTVDKSAPFFLDVQDSQNCITPPEDTNLDCDSRRQFVITDQHGDLTTENPENLTVKNSSIDSEPIPKLNTEVFNSAIVDFHRSHNVPNEAENSNTESADES